MKRRTAIAAAAAAFSMVASAQDPVRTSVKSFAFGSAVMGRAVKGAPYSADEITESSQVLGDGTHINHQSQVTVYRDGEGRVRRETPSQITIWDPVNNVSYVLDPKTKTASKSGMAWVSYVTRDDGGTANAGTFVMKSGSGNMTPAEMDQAKVEAMKKAAANIQITVDPVEGDRTMFTATLEKMATEMAVMNRKVMLNGSAANAQTGEAAREQLQAATQKLMKLQAERGNTESLGKQEFWGVSADGSRTTTTIQAGAIGNDRPIAVISERWYSADLQTVMMTRHSDPRTGEETFHLANVRRGEPGADLFVVPPGYTMEEGQPGRMPVTVK